MLKSIVAAAAVIAVAGTVQGAVVSFSNATTDSYAQNFHQLVLNGSGTVLNDTTAGNLLHTNPTTSTASNLVAAYDTNGSAAGVTTFTSTSFVLSAVVTMNSAAGSSFGFFIGGRTDVGGPNNDMLALLNIDTTVSGSPDTLRFSPTANFQSNVITTNSFVERANSATALTAGMPIKLTLTATNGSFVLDARNGSTVLTSTAYTGFTLPASYEIGFRNGVSPLTVSGANFAVDDFTYEVAAVPEPMTLGTAALAIAGAMVRRPKR